MRHHAYRLVLFLAFMVTPLKAEEAQREWGLDFSFQQYFVPSEDDLSTPVLGLTVDNWLVEGRYNYESQDSGSLWLGRSFRFGETWEFELTPMAGGVFGSVQGMAPGLKADINWKALNLYSEMEYFFSFETKDDYFFYSWTELTIAPADWLSIGLVGTRTRAYDSSVDIDRGPIVRCTIGDASVYGVAMNLDENVLVVLGIELSM